MVFYSQTALSFRQLRIQTIGWDMPVIKSHAHAHARMHTHTHTTVLQLWILSGTTRVSRYQKKHSPTHTYRGHQLSLVCFIRQFTCLTIFFHNFSPSFLRSTSWLCTLHFILHIFLHSIIVFFLRHMPIPSKPVLL